MDDREIAIPERGDPLLIDRPLISRIRIEQLLAVGIGLGILVLLGLRAHEAWESSGRRMGYALVEEGGVVSVESTEPGSPADLAGLQSGDLLLEIDGTVLSQVDSYDDIAQGFSRGDRVELLIRRQDRERTIVVEPGMAFPFLEFAILMPALLAFLALGLLALSRSRSDVRARLLALLSLSVAVELVLPEDAIGAPLVQQLSDTFYVFLTGLQIGLELHLVSVIPEEPKWLRERREIVWGFYLLGFGLAAPALLAALVEGLGGGSLPWTFDQGWNLLLDYGLPIWALGVLWLLGRTALHHPESIGRHQASLVLAGVLPWAVMVLGTTAMAIGGVDTPEWVAVIEPLLLLCLPLATFSAIYRYHLFDLELVVRRSLIYTLLTTMLVLLFYLFVGAGGALLSRFADDTSGVWAIAGATLLMGLLFSPLRAAVQRAIDRHFFHERTAMRQELVKLAATLPSLGNLPAMANELVRQLAWALGVRSATLLIATPESNILSTQASFSSDLGDGSPGILLSAEEPGILELKRVHRPLSVRQVRAADYHLGQRLELLEVELAVPVMQQAELVGVLLLGPRIDGAAYGAEEIELLSLLSHHVASVFENARLFESATRDGLTGLLRRGPLMRELERELRRALRFDRPITVGMIDLDRFKLINDQFGHLRGDLMLQQVARQMSEALRSSDLIGRFGGEEFLLVLPETDMSGAVRGADKIRAMVEDLEVTLESGETMRTTLSIGLASLTDFADEAEPSSSDLISAADRQLYLAKHRGRNRVEPSTSDSGRRLAVVPS